MSCKKPILMAIDGVSRKLVEDAQCGVYVEPENTNEYNRIIREYLNNADRLYSEGNNGYNYAKNSFDRSVLAKKYIDLIKEKAATGIGASGTPIMAIVPPRFNKFK